jgi:hypothetical protein
MGVCGEFISQNQVELEQHLFNCRFQACTGINKEFKSLSGFNLDTIY